MRAGGKADAAPRGRGTAGLWGHRDFMLLWGGQTLSEMGSAVTTLALPLVAVVILKASTLQIGLLSAASTAAFAVIALPAGALVDRCSKRRVMITCDTLRFAIISSVPVAAAAHVLTLAQLYAVAVTVGVCTVFFDVSYLSYLPSLVSAEQLVDGNGKLGATQAVAEFAGPSAGGGLVALVGAAGATTADAISYLISVISLFGIAAREEPVSPKSGESLRKEIAEGLSFILRHEILRRIVACTATSNLFSAMLAALETVFLIRGLHVRPALVGEFVAVSAIGGIVAGVFAGRLARRIGTARIIWVSVLVFGAPGFIAATAEPGWSVLLFPLGWGTFYFAAVVYNVAQISYRQAVTPPELMGRTNAAARWITWGMMPIGGILGGVLGTLIGLRPTLWVALIGTWAAGWFVFFSPLRRMRDFPAQPRVGSQRVS